MDTRSHPSTELAASGYDQVLNKDEQSQIIRELNQGQDSQAPLEEIQTEKIPVEDMTQDLNDQQSLEQSDTQLDNYRDKLTSEKKTEVDYNAQAAENCTICPCPVPVVCVGCPRRICRPKICKKIRTRARCCPVECRPICAPLPRPTYCPEPIPVNCPPPRARCCKLRRYCCPRPMKYCPPAVYCSPVPSVCPMPKVICPAKHPGYCYKPAVCQPMCADSENLITYKYEDHAILPNQRVLLARHVYNAGDRTGMTYQAPAQKTEKKDGEALVEQTGSPETKAGIVQQLLA